MDMETMKQDHGNESTGKRRRALLGRGVLTAAVGVFCAATMLARSDESGVDTARDAIAKWVETRRILSQERRDWELGRELLDDRIALVQREIEALQGRIADAQKNVGEADRKRLELLADNDRLKAASSALLGTVARLEGRTKSLLARLPDPIRERVKPLSQRFPDDPAQTKLSLAERFQNVVGVLNEVDKFHHEITMTSEVRQLRDGTAAEVTVLYVGISQAYYASANGKAAGVGSAGKEGWQWTPADDAAPEIRKAIAILRNEAVADFVHLPIRID